MGHRPSKHRPHARKRKGKRPEARPDYADGGRGSITAKSANAGHYGQDAGYRQRAEQRGYQEAGYGAPPEAFVWAGQSHHRSEHPEREDDSRPAEARYDARDASGHAFGGAGIGGHVEGSFGQYGPLPQRLLQTGMEHLGGDRNTGAAPPEPQIAEPLPRGGYRGRGPRGYHRSDQRIAEEVCDALCDDDFVDAEEIEVTVEQGEVTLAGMAPDRFTKRRAEAIAERCRGVHDVHNQLRVRRPHAEG